MIREWKKKKIIISHNRRMKKKNENHHFRWSENDKKWKKGWKAKRKKNPWSGLSLWLQDSHTCKGCNGCRKKCVRAIRCQNTTEKLKGLVGPTFDTASPTQAPGFPWYSVCLHPKGLWHSLTLEGVVSVVAVMAAVAGVVGAGPSNHKRPCWTAKCTASISTCCALDNIS